MLPNEPRTMLKLYGVTTSRAFRCLWMLEELGVPYEREPIDFRTGGTRDPAYLAVNPNGRVPALQEDGLVLWESMAINLYLAEKYGPSAGTALWPDSVAEHGLAYQWSLWVMTEVERHLLQVLHQRATLPEPERDEAKLRQAEGALQKPFAVLDGCLDGRDYLLGERFTVADLNVASVLIWAKPGRLDLSAYPAMKAWLDRCLGREARKRATRS